MPGRLARPRNLPKADLCRTSPTLPQTYSYSRHFISTCIRVCGYETTPGGVDANGQVTAVGYCPIGVDVERVMSDR
jgi:trehalose-6-phosphate synthase